MWNPRIKFAVEPAAETGDNGEELVHIRSCYNNKYLVGVKYESSTWLCASSAKVEEDRSKASCTLFRPSGGWNNISLHHVQSGNLVVDYTTPSTTSSRIIGFSLTDDGLRVSATSDNGVDVFQAIDAERLVILPSKVTFRSEKLEGNYIASRVVESANQVFLPDLDATDDYAAKELVPTPDGYYRIRDFAFGKFWRASPWILADAAENDHSDNTKFSFIKISGTGVALWNLGVKRFCGPITEGVKKNCLMADYFNISKDTRLFVEERVMQRSISNVKYRLTESRIYQESIQDVSNAFATNDSSVDNASISLTYSISDSRTTSWSNSVSVKVGASITFETTIVPFIEKSEIEINTEIGYEHTWDESKTVELNRESTYVVNVPPLSTVKVTLMCTQGACDVPFSYTQRDLLTTGEWVTTIMNDGLYTGINSYNFYFESKVLKKDDKGRLFLGK